MMELCTTLNRGQAIGASLQKIWKSHSIPISTKIRLTKALVWPVTMYGCESWTLRKNKETRLDAFEMKGLRKILWVVWTAKKTNDLVLNKAGVKRELLDIVKASKLAYLKVKVKLKTNLYSAIKSGDSEALDGGTSQRGSQRRCGEIKMC